MAIRAYAHTNLTISAQKNTSNDEKDEEGNYIRRERYCGKCSRSFYVGDSIKEEDAASDLAPPAGEAVGRHGGDGHLKDYNGNHQNDAVPEQRSSPRPPHKPPRP